MKTVSIVLYIMAILFALGHVYTTFYMDAVAIVTAIFALGLQIAGE